MKKDMNKKYMKDIILQERFFLLLTNNEEAEVLKNVFKSPLELAKELIILLNEKKYFKLERKLDKIKYFSAGINRAKSLKNYKLAQFYPFMFSFHQYFQSSFRARQGKILEKILQNILKNILRKYTHYIIPEENKTMKEIVKKAYNLEKDLNLDIDVLGKDDKNKKLLIMQIRSRDDTGGTTAKGSLIDLLFFLLKNGKTFDYKLTYLIAIWDERKSQQKKITISKIYELLEKNIKISKKELNENIEKGIQIAPNIILKLSYGISKIEESLFEWSNSKKILNSIEKFIERIDKWDDLWIAYAISSLEIENIFLNNKSNLDILSDYLRKNKIELNKEFDINLIDNITINIATQWKEDSIPLPSVSDKILYIRDLIYLKLIYNTIIK